MRAVIQVVTEASVEIEGEVVGRIEEPGLVVLVGATHDDGEEQCQWLARKITDLRILREEKSALDVGAPVLLVSQFTLYADVKKGRRPSWSKAAPGPVAEPLVDRLAELIRERGLTVETGRFGADMQVSLTNDGPVTIILDTPA
ncbi:MAG: D-aminoacyl-tRNA deacylase [Bowdeniella nasicola]|nr:D-aminoacyl-tRNA deacylase [Bowdeniella nasicola]